MNGDVIVADESGCSLKLISRDVTVSVLAGSTDKCDFKPKLVAINPSGTLAVFDDGQRILTISFSVVFPACDSTWHHIALTYSPTAAPYTLSAFLDGALVYSNSASITLPPAGDPSTSLRIGWGADAGANSGSRPFSGSLSELRIYNRALSQAEVVALSQPPLGAYGNLVTRAAPQAGAKGYAFACKPGHAGPALNLLLKSPVDNSWAWAGTQGVTPTCTMCAAGFAAAAMSGSIECLPCPLGTYALAGSSSCSLCPAGTYGSSLGLTTSACSGVCAGCPAGSLSLPDVSLTCTTGGVRAVPSSFGLQIWPAGNPQNPRNVDLVIAPLAQCQQMISTCSSAVTYVGVDGVTRYVVGSAADLHLETGEPLTCSGI